MTFKSHSRSLTITQSIFLRYTVISYLASFL